MKKVIIFFTILSGLFFGCSNISETDISNNERIFTEGNNSNKLRNQFKTALENEIVSSSRNCASIDSEENSIIFELPNDTTATEFLIENGIVSDKSEKYFYEVESVINNESLSTEDIISNIENIEMSAISDLTAEEYKIFLNFSEMSIAVLDYYSEDNEANRSIKSWFKKNRKKIKCAVISGALGACVGAFVGSLTGGITLPVVGTIPGGVVGAVSVGATSAIAGWNSEKITIKKGGDDRE